MLSRREKLLITPWQQRRYENHLKKVKQALPVIDNRPPLDRNHVWNKLKKQQVENERCAKIERDNFILLRKMNDIMKTRRVDNFWTTPPPLFLNRVTRYNITPSDIEVFANIYEDVEEFEDIKHLRKSKCSACTPRQIKEAYLPEERIPWESTRLEKTRSKSVPPKSLPKLTDSTNVIKSKSATSGLRKSRTESVYRRDSERFLKKGNSSQSITLTSGCLNLAVKFPPNTAVKYFDGPNEKIIRANNRCYCRNKDRL